MAPAGPGPWTLRVTQPPQSVAVAWDTSGSVGALVAAVSRAVKQFSWELQPGREEINLFPFRGDGSAPLLEAWSGNPAAVYAALHAYRWGDNSSDAESALLAAAQALEERIGTRAVALITDAAYSGVFKDEALWQALERARVRVFAIHLPVDPDPKRALAQINLMQDWASAGGGTFTRFATQDDGETAFRRITAWLARPADYAFSVAAEATPPPPGTLSVALAPDAAADPGTAADPGAAAAPLAVEIVLDASGSMLADLGGRARIEVAKQGLSDLGAGALPEGVTVGLRVFGHRGGTSCKSELVLPLAPLDRAAFAAAVETIRVKDKAKTALAESIRLAGADLAQLGGRRILVLVTDGLETCGGDPQAEIRGLRDQGLDVRLNVVGFALDDPAVRATFAQWASAGGGSYFDAADPAALAAAIGEAASGLPFVVVDLGGKEVAKGLVGGPPLELPAGRYRLVVGERTYPIEIRSGQPLSLTVEG
jgi:Mg-chelatase subunit ChlD